MHKLTTGLIAGGIIGAIGLTYAMSDKGARKRIIKDSKKVANKANKLMDKMDW